MSVKDHERTAELDARIADLDGLLLRLTPLGAETIARATRLKVVARYGVGYDNVDVDAWTERAIKICDLMAFSELPGSGPTVACAPGRAAAAFAMFSELPGSGPTVALKSPIALISL